LLAVDPGYPGYQESSAVNMASNHSLILVNGFGPLPPIGEAVSVETNTCWIEHFFDTPILDYGEIRTAYFGADIVRKNLFVRDRYFILSDFITSTNPNTYTFQLQGNGLIGGTPGTPEGAFFPDFTNDQGIYSRDSTQLLVHTVATNGASNYSNALDSLATGTSQYRHYSKMLVRKDSVPNTRFLSVLFPFNDTPPEVITLDAGLSVNAIQVVDGVFQDVIFAQQDSVMVTVLATASGFQGPIQGNGTVNLIGVDLISPHLFFLGHGDSLRTVDQDYIVSSHRIDVSYHLESDVVHSGYVSDSGWVGFYTFHPSEFVPTSGNFLEYYPDETNSLLWIRFASACRFTVEFIEGKEEQPSNKEEPLAVRNHGDGDYELIYTSEESFNGTLKIYQASGKCVLTRAIHGSLGNNTYPVVLTGFASGLYIFSITTPLNQTAIKLIHN
ncbi:MAG: hypothetical protein HQ542_11200, partial [Bacteroidia bacterium]|nr:hypothetical protein [Bacteroidia bacterium]